ncbi:hypothetical protein [Planktothrix sp. FACHB-1365]|uniref:hypothetical protein n=1 Tax=Planktothrix sp. FACHB-1365 TaxID=2692855 RepID=UPI001689A235|nr:hypothetical protein [Planktothrix sp. FACHB-1365]MBD2482442.1 hypothetical protein [Planktothrix sp. FACHB-1365]
MPTTSVNKILDMIKPLIVISHAPLEFMANDIVLAQSLMPSSSGYCVEFCY